MRQPTKAELVERNAALSRENEALHCLLFDLLRGEAAIKTQGDVTWLISRPGAASSGCVATYRHASSGTHATIDVGYLEDLIRGARSARASSWYLGSPEEDRRAIDANALCAEDADRLLQRGYAERTSPKLPSELGTFKRAKVGVLR